MVAGPVVGAFADAYAAKKRVLVATTAGCVLFTALLATTGRGDLALAAALLVGSNFFYAIGENTIAAFLPEIARPQELGRISSWGWSLGYVGGLLGLAVCLGYVSWAEANGQGAEAFVPVTMLITATVFVLASLPTFLFLRERARPQPHLMRAAISDAFARVGQTLRETRAFPDLGRFFLCSFAYQAGVTVVIALAAIYAQQAMGFSATETIAMVLVVNVTAALGAFAFGAVQDRIGHKLTIALTLCIWIAMIVIAYAATTRAGFWVAANLAGLALGASQSAGRALTGLLAPPGRRAEFFGLWGLVTRGSAIVGPVAYGAITWATGNQHRPAMLATGVFFVAGLALLSGLDVKRGYRAALRADRRAARGAGSAGTGSTGTGAGPRAGGSADASAGHGGLASPPGDAPSS
jgi:UMF1 family MFS transporter